MDQVNSSGTAETASLKLTLSLSDNVGDVFSAYVPVTNDLLAEIFRLQTLCRRWGLAEATVPWEVIPYETEFDPEDLQMGGIWATEEGLPEGGVDWRLDASYLSVGRDGVVSFSISVKHDGDYSATGITLDTIKRVVQDLRAG